jgi:ribonuclease HI
MSALWSDALGSTLSVSFKLISASVPPQQILASINSEPCLLTAYFEVCGQTMPIFVDTGATISFIPENGLIMKTHRLKTRLANMNVTLADNTIAHIDKKVEAFIRPSGDSQRPKPVTFYICNDVANIMGHHALIGLDQLKLFDLNIRCDSKNITIYCQDRLIGRQCPAPGPFRGSIKVDCRFSSLQLDNKLLMLLKRYKSVFTSIGPEPIRGQPMRILTTHNRPIFARQRHYNKDEIVEMKDRVLSLLNEGIIEPTHSGYSATSRIVPKKSGPGRLVVNYIPLNAVTLRDSYALPHVTDILGVLEGQRYFTTMDCAQGFYQILVDQRDRHKTAFSTPIGNYQFVRCPFGARNSCAVFQAEMNRIFAEGLYSRCVVYVDDILIFGKTREEHDANLDWVLARCKQFNIKIKLEKCAFAKTEVDYLGFKVSGRSIKPLEKKVETLCKGKPPRDKSELRSVIGKLNFYSRFISNYSQKLEPLRELFRKNKDFQWRPYHQAVYEELLKSLNEATPQLLTPRLTNKIIEIHLMKDSLEALCLTSDEELICRTSRLLSAAESNYSTVEKQLLALGLAIDKFRIWLDPDKFVVRVPTEGVQKALRLVNRPERVENLLLRLPAGFDSFNFEVKQSLMGKVQSQFTSHIPQEIYYVDGACRANGKPNCEAGWGVCAEFDRSIEKTGRVEEDPSNNSAELTAAIEACKLAKENGQNEITIVTDSRYLHSAATNWIDKWKNNEWLDRKKKPVVNTRLFKELIIAKDGLQIEWIHVKGHGESQGNIRADVLARSVIDEHSRAICSLMIGDRNIQPRNPEVAKLIAQIEAGERPDLLVEDGVVYRINPKVEEGDPRQTYVPEESRPYLLRLVHDNQMYGGHLGIKNTFNKLAMFWWPGKHRDVEKYCKSCEICQAFKRPSGLPNGMLHSIPVSAVFEHIHLDIVGPVTRTNRGNKYIITATDAFSKWAYARACQNVVTTEVIKFVEECIMAVHGEPKVMITDRGVQFRSEEWKNFIRRTSIQCNLTSGYHPQSNGIDERLNGTLVRILVKYVDEFQENWDEELKWALFVYNTTAHKSTGFSPYAMLHGFNPRNPMNADKMRRNMDMDEVTPMRDRIRELAREQIVRSQAKQTVEYNRRHRPINLKIGDLVWVKEHVCPSELSKKLYPKYQGPHAVIRIFGDQKNPRALAIWDSFTLKRRTVSLQDVKIHEDRPRNLENSSRKEGEVQDFSCAEDVDSLHVSATGDDYSTDGQNEPAIDLMHEQDPEASDESVRKQFDCNFSMEEDPDQTELLSSTRRASQKDGIVNFSPSSPSLETTVREDRPPRRVTINQNVETILYDKENNLEPVESADLTHKSPYAQEINIDDPVRDPTYKSNKFDIPPSNRVTRSQSKKNDEDLSIESCENPIRSDDISAPTIVYDLVELEELQQDSTIDSAKLDGFEEYKDQANETSSNELNLSIDPSELSDGEVVPGDSLDDTDLDTTLHEDGKMVYYDAE